MIRECCICGRDTHDVREMVCDICKPIYEGQEYLTVLDAVIHNEISVEKGREILKKMSELRESTLLEDLQRRHENLDDSCEYI